jgi:hypothetical protein
MNELKGFLPEHLASDELPKCGVSTASDLMHRTLIVERSIAADMRNQPCIFASMQPLDKQWNTCSGPNGESWRRLLHRRFSIDTEETIIDRESHRESFDRSECPAHPTPMPWSELASQDMTFD